MCALYNAYGCHCTQNIWHVLHALPESAQDLKSHQLYSRDNCLSQKRRHLFQKQNVFLHMQCMRENNIPQNSNTNSFTYKGRTFEKSNCIFTMDRFLLVLFKLTSVSKILEKCWLLTCHNWLVKSIMEVKTEKVRERTTLP